MIHESHPGRADDRGGDGGRERGGEAEGFLTGLAQDLHQTYPGGEWLAPAWSALGRGFELIDRARMVLTLVAGAVVLLYLGAKLEREMQKRQLQVLDGAAAGDQDLTEERRGDRAP